MLHNKKIYEAPDAQVYGLQVQEDLLTTPTVSNTGYGYDDQGPITAVNGDL